MRLLNTHTIKLEEFSPGSIPKYAILSHRWETEEVTFEDIKNLETGRKKYGFRKLEGACELARNESFSYMWIDTCCIDKTSSAELQEAINSMYKWYADAEICYAFLSDFWNYGSQVLDDSIPRATDQPPPQEFDHDIERYYTARAFSRSKWFTRGWTLQELIAPKLVDFYDKDWCFSGSRSTLTRTISDVTNIEIGILDQSRSMASISVAQKMSWAAKRETTRVEDQAYSLLGLFDVSMSMLYGEGNKAFTRLQEEILKTSTDHSIFAWDATSAGELLARSPRDFAASRSIVQWGKASAFEMTNRGLRITLPLLKRERWHGYEEYWAVLNCREELEFDQSLALRLRKYKQSDEYYAIHGDDHRHADDRLAHVNVRAFQNREKGNIDITRTFESESMGVKFRLQPDPGYQSTRVYTTHGRWDKNHKLLDTGVQPYVRAAVMLTTPSGNNFFVAFGYNWVDLRDRSVLNGIMQSNFSLQLRAIRHEGTLEPERFALHWNYVTSCRHREFPCRTCGRANFNRQPDSELARGTPVGYEYEHEMFLTRSADSTKHDSVPAYEHWSGAQESLEAQISMEQAMGETVFNVFVRPGTSRAPITNYTNTEVYELEAEVPLQFSRAQESITPAGNPIVIDPEQTLTWVHARRTSFRGEQLNSQIRDLQERQLLGVKEQWPGHLS